MPELIFTDENFEEEVLKSEKPARKTERTWRLAENHPRRATRMGSYWRPEENHDAS